MPAIKFIVPKEKQEEVLERLGMKEVDIWGTILSQEFEDYVTKLGNTYLTDIFLFFSSFCADWNYGGSVSYITIRYAWKGENLMDDLAKFLVDLYEFKGDRTLDDLKTYVTEHRDWPGRYERRPKFYKVALSVDYYVYHQVSRYSGYIQNRTEKVLDKSKFVLYSGLFEKLIKNELRNRNIHI